MENASKALLIAGAILIAILLIAIGMRVFQSASGVVNSAGTTMSGQEKTMFNQQWTIYEGHQSGSTVRSLVAAIRTNNSNADTPNIGLTITPQVGSAFNITRATNGTITDPGTQPPIVTQSQYNVVVTPGADGLISQITATQMAN